MFISIKCFIKKKKGHTTIGDYMNLIEYVLFPVLSLIVLFILTKLMGYRQVSQLNMYDYIIGITIGSIAAEFIIGGFEDYLTPLIAMIIYTLVTLLLSVLCTNSSKARIFIEGKPLILYENDVISNENLKKSKIDIDELLMQCRINGYFDLNELKMIVLETNGNLSFLPKEQYRPCIFDDLDKSIPNDNQPILIIKNGEVLLSNLKKINNDINWLESQLNIKGYLLEDVILAFYYPDTNIKYYLTNKNKSQFI